MDDRVPPKLLSRLSSASEIVRKHDFIHIFSHYDADGISAAGILAKTFLRSDISFSVTLFSTLNDGNMEIIEKSNSKCIVIADMGASYLDRLDALSTEKDIIVLDHHRTPRDSDSTCYVNPHLFGVDGMTDCCGASLSFLFSVTMDEDNWGLSQIAMAGIVGDRQHIRPSGPNAFILERAVKDKHIFITEGSLIPSGELNKELFLTTDPFISGVSGNVDGVAALLKGSGITAKTFTELSENDVRKLSSTIALKLISSNVTTRTMSEASRTRYRLNDWMTDAENMSDMLNACGRMDLGGMGVAMILGDERSRIDAERLNDNYRTKVVNAAAELELRGLSQMSHIQYFDSTASGFTGVLCGIAMQYFGDPDRPTIGMNSSDGTVKVSARGTWEQLAKGIDLSTGMELAAKKVGGQGGGHRIASGASFPMSSEQQFLDSLNEIIKEQISAR